MKTQQIITGLIIRSIHEENKTKRMIVETRFNKLMQRLPAKTVKNVNVAVEKERIGRARDYFHGLIDLGTPQHLIDVWWNGVRADEIIVGMPTDLVRNYWGDPMATETTILEEGPAEVWSCKIGPGVVKILTVFKNKVMTVSVV